MRDPVGLAYLLARAADTIADTDLLPPALRVTLLSDLLRSMQGDEAAMARLRHTFVSKLPSATALHPAEHTLLLVLPDCVALHREAQPTERQLVARVLDQLVLGMQKDLQRFPAAGSVNRPEQVVALQDEADLDEYTYLAAGCVGEFWTDLQLVQVPQFGAHWSPKLRVRGKALGQALQITNVVRDMAADLKMGRCYVPQTLLERRSLHAARLYELVQTPPRDMAEARALSALTQDLLRLGLSLCETAWPYVLALPPKQVRLRLACAWPLCLALETLRLVGQVGSPLFSPHQPVRVSRSSVYAMLFSTTAVALLAGLAVSEQGLVQAFETRRRALKQLVGDQTGGKPWPGDGEVADEPACGTANECAMVRPIDIASERDGA